MTGRPLKNIRHERFAQLVTGGASTQDAYRLAGYKPKASSASRMLHDEKIQERIRQLELNGARRSEITVARVLDELALIAFSDITDFADWDGTRIRLKASADLPRGKSPAIHTVRETTAGVTIKLHDKLPALDKIARYLGMLVERTDHTSSDGSMSPSDVNKETITRLIKKLTG